MGQLTPQVTGVHTLPVHPSTSDGGFSVVDHALVDAEHGTWADLEALSRDVRWMGDAVVNHVSASSPWLARYLAGDPSVAGFFRELPDDTDVHAVIRPRLSALGHPFRRADASEVRLWTTFSADQVDLDFADPEVLVVMTEALLRFVRHGATAIRLDAIAFAWKDPARSSMSLPETHAVVAFWRACVDEACPDVLLLTETNVADAENVSYFGTESRPEAGAVYRFALPPLVLYALCAGTTTELVGWLQSLEPSPAGTAYANILSTHDGIGLRGSEGILTDGQRHYLADHVRAAGGVVNERATAHGPVPYELCTTWYSVMAAGVNDAEALARHVAGHAIALAVDGFPMIYLGALLAATNDEARFAVSRHGRDLNRTRFELAATLAAIGDPSARSGASWAALRTLLARRAVDTAFAPGTPQRVDRSTAEVVVIERTAPDGHVSTVAVNVTGRPASAVVDGVARRFGAWEVYWPGERGNMPTLA